MNYVLSSFDLGFNPNDPHSIFAAARIAFAVLILTTLGGVGILGGMIIAGERRHRKHMQERHARKLVDDLKSQDEPIAVEDILAKGMRSADPSNTLPDGFTKISAAADTMTDMPVVTDDRPLVSNQSCVVTIPDAHDLMRHIHKNLMQDLRDQH
jgi:hypothetical protein